MEDIRGRVVTCVVMRGIVMTGQGCMCCHVSLIDCPCLRWAHPVARTSIPLSEPSPAAVCASCPDSEGG